MKARQTLTYPEYFVRKEENATNAFHDIALVRIPLVNDSLTPVSLPLPHEDTEYIDLAKKVVIVSRGITKLGDPEYSALGKTKATGWLSSYRCIRGDLVTIPSHRYLCLFSLSPHQFVTCGGDSGSPVFSDKGHRRVVMAVIYYAYHSCLREEKAFPEKLVTLLQRVTPYMPWILHTIDAHPSHHRLHHLMSSWMISPFTLLELP